MDDVVRKIVLAGRDEDLGPGDLVAAIALLDGFGA